MIRNTWTACEKEPKQIVSTPTEPRTLSICPITEYAHVFRRELRASVYPGVGADGHRSVLNLIANLFQFPGLSTGVVDSPLREIQMFSTLIDVIYEQP